MGAKPTCSSPRCSDSVAATRSVIKTISVRLCATRSMRCDSDFDSILILRPAQVRHDYKVILRMLRLVEMVDRITVGDYMLCVSGSSSGEEDLASLCSA